MENEIEVMRVVRVPPMGRLVVHSDGRRLKQLAGVKDPQLRQRLLAAIGELVVFAGGYDALVEAGVAPPLVATSGGLAARADDEAQLTSQQAAFLDHLERKMHTSSPSEMGPGGGELGLGERPATLDEAPQSGSTGVNLVAEIDSILQKHVAANGQLAHRHIHLRQAPGQLLQIVVDGKTYEHPNEIEDEDVRQALKQALKEWEAR
jgi:hypothetical protein